jgi:glutamate dehydrogenase
MGINFIQRMQESTGASLNAIIKAYITARDVFDMDDLWEQIERLDFTVTTHLQRQMMTSLIRTVRRACRWFLRNRRKAIHVEDDVLRFRNKAIYISTHLDDLLSGEGHAIWQQYYQQLLDENVPKQLARKMAGINNMFSVLSIIEAGEQITCELPKVATLYYMLGEYLEIAWFLEQLNQMPVTNHWQVLARDTHRDDLDWQQRTLTVSILNREGPDSAEDKLSAWSAEHHLMISRWHKTVTELQEGKIIDFSVFTVALRELLDLAQACKVENI